MPVPETEKIYWENFCDKYNVGPLKAQLAAFWAQNTLQNEALRGIRKGQTGPFKKRNRGPGVHLMLKLGK